MPSASVNAEDIESRRTGSAQAFGWRNMVEVLVASPRRAERVPVSVPGRRSVRRTSRGVARQPRRRHLQHTCPLTCAQNMTRSPDLLSARVRKVVRACLSFIALILRGQAGHMQAFKPSVCDAEAEEVPANLPITHDGRAYGRHAHGRLQRQRAGHDAPQQGCLCLLKVGLQLLSRLPVVLLRLSQLQRLHTYRYCQRLQVIPRFVSRYPALSIQWCLCRLWYLLLLSTEKADLYKYLKTIKHSLQT